MSYELIPLRVQQLRTLDSGGEKIMINNTAGPSLDQECWDVRQTTCVGLNPTCTSPLLLAIVVRRPWGDS